MAVRRRRTVVRGLVVGLLLAVVVGTVAYAATTDLQTSAAFAGIASLLVSAVGVVLDLTGLAGGDQHGRGPGELVDDLARTIHEQWIREAAAPAARSTRPSIELGPFDPRGR